MLKDVVYIYLDERYILYVYTHGTSIPEVLERYDRSNGGLSRYILYVYIHGVPI